MAHPVSTFQLSDVGFGELDRAPQFILLEIRCDQSLPFKGDARNKALGPERDLRPLLVLGSCNVAPGRADAPKRDCM